jgi:hypothetical protein
VSVDLIDKIPVETLLFWIGLAAETLLLAFLIRTHAYKILPAFFVYICWSPVGDIAMHIVQKQALPFASYLRIYEVQMVTDAAFMFAVLVELAWSVLKPLRASLPRKSWIAIPFLMVLAGAIIWPLAGMVSQQAFTPAGNLLVRLQQTFAILRVVIFFAMAGFSQLIGLGWRNRELQVATGLGFYSILSLAVSVTHLHQSVGSQYHWLDELGSAGYIMALAYWSYAFATKEAERQNFSPQMANFLLLIGGTAKAQRVAVRDFSVTRSRYKDH